MVTPQGISEYKDWYNVSLKQVFKHGGGSLLKHYKGSLIRLLAAVFPEYAWTPWRAAVPHNVHNGKVFSKVQYALLQSVKRVSN